MLQKRIPEAAGLFDLSNNIATILFGLNQLFGFPTTDSLLTTWAKELSHAASFFFTSGLALIRSGSLQELDLNHFYEKPMLLATATSENLPQPALIDRLSLEEVATARFAADHRESYYR